MKGYPKHLNTREDYEYVHANFPSEKWLPSFKALLEGLTNWFFEKNLKTRDEGIEDETHKIVENTTTDAEGIETTTYAQYVLKTDTNAKIFRMGYTVAEVEAIIAEAEGK